MNILQKIRQDKQEYRAHMARMASLPADYRFVFEKMVGYLWGFAGGDGMDMLKTQYQLLELLEEGAAQGRHVLDITGQDVAGFCNELLRDNRLWTDGPRRRLNRSLNHRSSKGR